MGRITVATVQTVNQNTLDTDYADTKAKCDSEECTPLLQLPTVEFAGSG